MTLRTALVAAALALAACSPALRARYADLAALPAPAPGETAPAVVLLHESRLLLQHRLYETQSSEHVVLKILDERALDEAKVRFYGAAGAKLTDFVARSVSPDGTAHEVSEDAVHLDHSGSPERGSYELFSFQFPHVAVGSTLEYAYTLTTEDLPRTWQVRLAGPYPVRTYRVEAQFTSTIGARMKAFHIRAPVTFDDGLPRRLFFEAHDVPAHPHEALAPDPEAYQPFVLFSLTELGSYDAGTTWATALERRAGMLAALKRAGVTPDVDVPFEPAGCADEACVVARAVEQVRALAAYDGYADSIWDARPLAAVLDTKTANSLEKVKLLEKLLQQQDVPSRLVFVNRPQSGDFDPDFPSEASFDHVLVQVLPKDERQPPIWVDPSCEECATDVLPPWSAGMRGIALQWKKAALRAGAWQAEPVTVPAWSKMKNTVEQRHEVTIAANGDARVTYEETTTGVEARDLARGTREVRGKKLEKAVEDDAHRRTPGAGEVTNPVLQCDRAAGRCRYGFSWTIPGYATRDGRRLLVPLTLLDGPWDGHDTPELRHEPIATRFDIEHTDRVTVRLPSGCVADAPPADATATSGPYTTSVTWRRLDDGAVEATRSLHVRPGFYPPTAYPAMRKAVQLYTGARQAFVTCREPPPSP